MVSKSKSEKVRGKILENTFVPDVNTVNTIIMSEVHKYKQNKTANIDYKHVNRGLKKRCRGKKIDFKNC